MSELFSNVNAVNFADNNLCVNRNINACQCCDCVCRLTNNLCVKCTVDKDSLSNLFSFFFVKEVASSVLEFLLNLIINTL